MRQDPAGAFLVNTIGVYNVLGQPAVSLQVQALERELRTKLFDRQRGAVTLTVEGEILFDIAVPMIEALESVDDAFR